MDKENAIKLDDGIAIIYVGLGVGAWLLYDHLYDDPAAQLHRCAQRILLTDKAAKKLVEVLTNDSN